jgi:hypothetical protein
MITNFESITRELTPEEVEILPFILKGLQGHRKENPIKAPEIVRQFNDFLRSRGKKIRITEPRLRKFCNHIRTGALLPLIATPAGYFVSWDKNDILSQVTSLEQRASSISESARGLKNFI